MTFVIIYGNVKILEECVAKKHIQNLNLGKKYNEQNNRGKIIFGGGTCYGFVFLPRQRSGYFIFDCYNFYRDVCV